MSSEEEKIALVKSSLSKIMYLRDSNGKRSLHANSVKIAETLKENAEILEDNFERFALQSSSLMRPATFIYAVQEIEGGKKLIFDNIDFLLTNHAHARSELVSALSEMDGISEELLNDFENKFYLFVYGDENIHDEYVNNPKYDNYSNIKMPPDRKYRLIQFLNAILKDPNAHDMISKHKDIIFSPKNNSAMPQIAKMLMENSEYNDILKDNIDQIKKAFIEEDLPAFYQNLKHVYPEEYEKNKFVIEKIYEPSMKYLEDNKENMHRDSYTIVSKKNLKTCGRIIAQDRSKDIETLVDFAASGKDLELCHDGGTAIVIKANERVFKLSANRIFEDNFDIKYHPRLLRPIVRKKDVSRNPEKSLFIEIQDEVDMDIEVSDEELLDIYKELRAAGIKWCDAKKANLGRLKKDNYAYPDGANMPSNNANLGFLGADIDNKVLKAGELVIVDNDGIYDLKDKNALFTPQTAEFIVEYEEECIKNEKAKKPQMPEEH